MNQQAPAKRASSRKTFTVLIGGLLLVSIIGALVLRPRSPSEKLIEGINSGNVAKVRQALSDGLDPDTRWYYSGQPDYIFAFGRRGRMNATAPTALMWAVRLGRHRIADLLLQAGANPNLTSKHEGTALAIAARHNDTPSILLLLQHGAHPDKGLGDPPIFDTVGLNNVTATQALVKAGADLSFRNRGGRTVRDIAESAEMVRALRR